MNTELIMAAEEQKKKITNAIQDIRDTATYLNTINELGDKLQLVLQGAGKTIYLEKLMAPEILEANRQLILRDIKNAE